MLCDARKSMKMGVTNAEKPSLKTKHLAPIFRAETDKLPSPHSRQSIALPPYLAQRLGKVLQLLAGRGALDKLERLALGPLQDLLVAQQVGDAERGYACLAGPE